MTEEQLGKMLKEEYDSAPYGNRLLCFHLFGIRHAAVIAEYDLRVVKNLETGDFEYSHYIIMPLYINSVQY